VIVENVEDPGSLADLVASNIGLRVGESQGLIEISDPLERLHRVKDILAKELELAVVQDRIQSQAKEEMGKSQREYFLREQLRAIQAELGESDARAEDVAELRQKLDAAKLPEEAKGEAEKQLRRLETMHPEAAEYSMLRTYMDWLVDLPWSRSTRDNLDIGKARKVLDEDHYNLEKVKERILEFLAVRKLKKEMKGPILCFVGPPGVGKTSLGKSVARALGRKFVRISTVGIITVIKVDFKTAVSQIHQSRPGIIQIAPRAVGFLPAGGVAEGQEKLLTINVAVNREAGSYPSHFKRNATPTAIRPLLPCTCFHFNHWLSGAKPFYRQHQDQVLVEVIII
jgi:ATP-dependent Lon protease